MTKETIDWSWNMIFPILMAIYFLKSVMIGSDFNFLKYFRQGKKYSQAYKHWLSLKP